MGTLDEAISAVQAYGDDRYTQGQQAQQTTDQAVIDQANAAADAAYQKGFTAGVASVTPAPTPTPTPAGKNVPVPAAGKCLFGAAPQKLSGSAFAQLLGLKRLAVQSFYENLTRGKLSAGVATAAQADIIPLIGLSCTYKQNAAGTVKTWTHADVAAGKHDAEIIVVLKLVAALNVPCFVAYNVEPDTRINQGYGGGTAAEFAAAHKHVAGLIRQYAPNASIVTWLGGGNTTLASQLFPSTADVDWVTGDPYRWTSHSSSETAAQTWAPFCTWAKKQFPGKPIGITETGTDVNGHTDAQNVAWIASIPAGVTSNGISLLVLFDHDQRPSGAKEDWLIDDRPPLVAAAAKVLSAAPFA